MSKPHEYKEGDPVMVFHRYLYGDYGDPALSEFGKWRPDIVVSVETERKRRYGGGSSRACTMLTVQEEGKEDTTRRERRKDQVLPRAVWDETEGPAILADANRLAAKRAADAAVERALAMELASMLLPYTVQSALADVIQKEEVERRDLLSVFAQDRWVKKNHGLVTDARAELEKRGLVEPLCGGLTGYRCAYLQGHRGDHAPRGDSLAAKEAAADV